MKILGLSLGINQKAPDKSRGYIGWVVIESFFDQEHPSFILAQDDYLIDVRNKNHPVVYKIIFFNSQKEMIESKNRMIESYGYLLGAQSVNPKIPVLIVSTKSFNKVEDQQILVKNARTAMDWLLDYLKKNQP